jgi:uncharacterized protein YyaL (SSP411 family)
MPNQLIHETSPYLLQHADNPVDWKAWTHETLEKARSEDKPIFLSIGYAACHWCHVMAHESFESPDIAALLNQNFICIKVDREERPDIDSVYMDAVVAMTGSGGWPMSVFLTPEGQPFYGGTYFPPFPRYGMPAFRDVIQAAARAWRDDRSEIRKSGQNLTSHLASAIQWKITPNAVVRPNLLEQSLQALLGGYDWQRGGWGRAPLFPQPMSIEFLLLQASRGNRQALEAARHSLHSMSKGGMYDVVGGGFHRYSTDDVWLVPHFEKMLYDNAQLASAYLHAHLLSGDESFRRTTVETLDFILRELTHPEGGFYSSLDADSDGEEGKFYVWSLAELRHNLAPADFELLSNVYSLSREGNFEGHIILQRRAELGEVSVALNISLQELSSRLDAIHSQLLAVRGARLRPQTDDKILVSWNALALRAFAEAGRYLNRPDYIAAAQRNAAFLLTELHLDGSLMRAWRAGQARHHAFLEDHAALILGLLALYQSDPDPRWYAAAEQIAQEMLAAYTDPAGGFFDARPDASQLYLQPKNNQDNATPCGNALAALALLQLSEYNGQTNWHELAMSPIAAQQDMFVRHPAAFGQWLQALDFLNGPVAQVVLVGEPGDPNLANLRQELWRAYRPRLVAAETAPAPHGGPVLLQDHPLLNGLTAAYVCRAFTCQLPVTSPSELAAQLK